MLSGTLGIWVIVRAMGILWIDSTYFTCIKMSTEYLGWKKDKSKQSLTVEELIINLVRK